MKEHAVESPFTRWLREQTADGCWNSGHHITAKTGYVGVWHNGKTRLAHRVAYEALVGPIPKGLVIDHLCRVHHCVNPAHLEAVSKKENTRRGLRGVLTVTCQRGHPYDDANTRTDKRGKRYCRYCDYLTLMRRYHRKRGTDFAPPTYEEYHARFVHRSGDVCRHGHLLVMTKAGGRTCRTCDARREREYRERKRVG